MKSLSGLRCFVEVARTGSFALAARHLALSTSAVSKAVSRFEDDNGVRLLNRTTRRVSLTHDGERVLQAALPPLRDLESLVTDLGEARAEARGLLRVSVPVAWGRQWLVPRLPALFASHPALRLELIQEDRAADLVGDRVDVVVRTGSLADSQSLVVRRLFVDPLVTCAAPAYLQRRGRPQRPPELADHECISHRTLLNGRLYPWRFLIDGQMQEVHVAGRLVMNDGESVARAARQGLGVSQMPLFLAKASIESGTLMEVLADYRPPPMIHTLLYTNRRLVSARVRAFVDFVVAAAGDTAVGDTAVGDRISAPRSA